MPYLSGVSGMFSVSGLAPGHDYVITIVRVSNRGKSSPVTLEALTLRMAENRMSKYTIYKFICNMYKYLCNKKHIQVLI